MSSFWGSSSKKPSFNNFFIKWLPFHFLFKVPVYLGGAHEGNLNLNTCIKFEPCQDCTTFYSLYCEHEETDNRLLYYINHAINEDHHERVIVASPDTDMFVCLVHHITPFQSMDLLRIKRYDMLLSMALLSLFRKNYQMFYQLFIV